METKSGYVTIIGKPNAGKSTLMNALLGEKLSIITNKPQTTRKNIFGILSDDKHQIIFLDTPGILKPNYLLQEKMVEFIELAIKDADILLVLFDIDADPTGEEILENDELFVALKKSNVIKLGIINKVDLSNDNAVESLVSKIEGTNLFDEVMMISAQLKFNTEALLEKLKNYLPKGPKYYPDDQLTTENERFFVSEIIREKILEIYKEEVPFSTEVLIEEFKERENAKDYISAAIVVERDSQKPIIIGKNGEMIKRLGKISRAAIEEFLGREVYLELRVKVRPKWRSDPLLLKNFGYNTGNE